MRFIACPQDGAARSPTLVASLTMTMTPRFGPAA